MQTNPEPLRYINIETNEVLLSLERVIGGSLRYPQQVFVCPKCLKHYFLPYFCKRHFERCTPFEDGIHIVDNNKSPLVETMERLAYFSKRFQRIDFPLINRYEVSKTHLAFILIRKGRVAGYFVWKIHKWILLNKRKWEGWTLWDMFLFPSYRGKGLGKELLIYSTNYLKIKTFTVEEPNKNAIRFLKKHCSFDEKTGLWTLKN